VSALDAALAALINGQTDEALTQIDAAWRANPTLELRALACAAKPPEPLGIKGSVVAKAAGAAMEAPRHPRLSAALEKLLTDVPFTADSSKPSWAVVFSLVRYVNDPSYLALAKNSRRRGRFGR